MTANGISALWVSDRQACEATHNRSAVTHAVAYRVGSEVRIPYSFGRSSVKIL
jgi:hypothetical protein